MRVFSGKRPRVSFVYIALISGMAGLFSNELLESCGQQMENDEVRDAT